MAGRKLKPDEKRAWAGVTRSITPHPEAQLPDMAELEAALKQAVGQGQPVRRSPTAKAERGPLRHPLAVFEADRRKLLAPPDGGLGLADRGVERRVRRGQMEISGTLDLHGYTQDSARAAFLGFVRQHQGTNSRCVLVITGKGKRGEGVLRRRFLQWLEEGAVRAGVSGYASAHQKHGGSGAFYVFLRRRA